MQAGVCFEFKPMLILDCIGRVADNHADRHHFRCIGWNFQTPHQIPNPNRVDLSFHLHIST